MPANDQLDDLPLILKKILNEVTGDWWDAWGFVKSLEQQIDRSIRIRPEFAVSLLDAFDLIEICVQPSMEPSQKAEFAWRLCNRYFAALSKLVIEAARPEREAEFRNQREFLIAKFWHETERRAQTLRHGGWHEFEEITAQARQVLSPAVGHNGFGVHGEPNGSCRLRDLFRGHGYQGQNPRDAEFIFISLDANWDMSMSQQPAALIADGKTLLDVVAEYVEDPETFWNQRGVHHPLCLNNDKSDGRRFHERLRKILDFTGRPREDLIRKISFVELLELPTYGKSTAPGNKRIRVELMAQPRNLHHIRNILIRDVFSSREQKKIFICGSGTWKDLGRLKRVCSLNEELAFLPDKQFPGMARLNAGDRIETLFEHEGCLVYPMLHLSATGTDRHLQQVAELLQ